MIRSMRALGRRGPSNVALRDGYNSMLVFLLEADHPDVAVELLQSHVLGATNRVITADVQTMNLAIISYSDIECWDAALSILETMRQRGLKPNQTTQRIAMRTIDLRNEEESEQRDVGTIR